MAFSVPNEITFASEITSAEHEQNYGAIETDLNTEVIRRDGSVAMLAELELSGAPVSVNGAATKGYVDGASTSAIPIGVFLDYGGDTAPGGFALAQGQLMTKTENPILYALFGSKYGVETGTQFYLPDLRERVVVGKGVSSWAATLGLKGGSKDAVSISHNHTFNDYIRSHSGLQYAVVTSGTRAIGTQPPLQTEPNSTAFDGVAGTDKNLQPYIVLNKIVRLG